jgi:TolB-like protein
MGRVYRARDGRLGRLVAIKVLGADLDGDADAIARLRREAEAASSLNHPAIVTIYDIGESADSGVYIAMELIDGLSLREWLRTPRSREEKLDVLKQVAGGLAAAHAHGIVHRDIKPENMMVSSAGFAKVVDFGLAKPVNHADASAATDVRITAHGRVVGTFAYMSPEQLAGESLDARSDIYSFGCVLRDAFGNDPAFARIIERCLQKDRALRYQSMHVVAAELGEAPPFRYWPWVAAAAAIFVVALTIAIALRAPRTASGHNIAAGIAVLPFRALGPQSESYVADGLSDALTTDLARQPGLTVIDRNSSRHFASDADLHKTASDLGVRYVLLGSIQPAGGIVRVDARLVDTTNDAHVWADHFERPLSDVFSAENAIVRAVAAKLTPAAVARAVAQPTDPRVADLFLRARFFAEDVSWPVEDRSIPLLEQVVQLDPNFLPARVSLAQQYQRKTFESDPDRAWAAKAFVELQKILAQDPASAAAYTLRGNLHWNRTYGFAHDEALADMQQAIRIDPNFVDAWNSRAAIFTHIGLLDEAMNDYRQVLRLDPFNAFARYRIARVHLFQRKCAEASAEFSEHWPNDFQLPIALECAGRGQEALATLDRLKANDAAGAGANSDAASARAVVYAIHGRRAEAERELRLAIAGERASSHFHHAMYFIAAAYAQMRDATSALHWLERTSREGMPCYPLFASDALLDPIRSDPRMRSFLDGSRREWEKLRHQYGS